jgi:hypothetical protein
MTGYTVHTGTTVKFSNGWDKIFSKGAKKKPAAAKSTGAKPAAKKMTAAKKSGKNQSSAKKRSGR